MLALLRHCAIIANVSETSKQTDTKEETKNKFIRLAPETHERIKLNALKLNVSMTALVTEMADTLPALTRDSLQPS